MKRLLLLALLVPLIWTATADAHAPRGVWRQAWENFGWTADSLNSSDYAVTNCHRGAERGHYWCLAHVSFYGGSCDAQLHVIRFRKPWPMWDTYTLRFTRGCSIYND